ncbi:MAG: hypothetical protein KJZ86_00150 [Caldilineaceae bacterium]|nr:hypothetical protein [Caldilineaceae bacterium]HRJ42688.1 hypothetical protein [Caldilineaceae bacterium]
MGRIAAILALIIGSMAIFAGGQVLLGKIPDYYVIDWLPVYNFTVGVVTVFLTAILIWKNNRWAMPAAIGTFSIHAAVMLILQTVYSQTVAPDSIVAMSVRLVAWLIILALMFFQSRKNAAL